MRLNKIFYHSLLDPDANKGRPLPSGHAKLKAMHAAANLLAAGSTSITVTLLGKSLQGQLLQL